MTGFPRSIARPGVSRGVRVFAPVVALTLLMSGCASDYDTATAEALQARVLAISESAAADPAATLTRLDELGAVIDDAESHGDITAGRRDDIVAAMELVRGDLVAAVEAAEAEAAAAQAAQREADASAAAKAAAAEAAEAAENAKDDGDNRGKNDEKDD